MTDIDSESVTIGISLCTQFAKVIGMFEETSDANSGVNEEPAISGGMLSLIIDIPRGLRGHFGFTDLVSIIREGICLVCPLS